MTVVNLEPIIDADEAMRICSIEPVLSFENFVRVRNNFRLHFVKTWIGGVYRKQEAYRKCREKHPDFCNLVRYSRDRCDHPQDVYVVGLYKAYKMMRPYASSNWEMFI